MSGGCFGVTYEDDLKGMNTRVGFEGLGGRVDPPSDLPAAAFGPSSCEPEDGDRGGHVSGRVRCEEAAEEKAPAGADARDRRTRTER